jgi:hypothetical protein
MNYGTRRTTAHPPIEYWKIIGTSYGKVRRVRRVRRRGGQVLAIRGAANRVGPSHAKFRKFKQKAHAAHSSLVTMLLSAVRMTSVSIQAAGYKEGSIRQLCRVAGCSTRSPKFKLRHHLGAWAFAASDRALSSICFPGTLRGGRGRSKVWDLQAGTAWLLRTHFRKIPKTFF